MAENTVMLLPMPAKQIDVETVTALKRALEAAEEGELRSVAIAGVTPRGEAYTAFTPRERIPLIGAVQILLHRILTLAMGE